MDENSDSVEKAAKALSALGASKGGTARAKKLSPEERSAIARAAVEARWAKAGKDRIPFASHVGELDIGGAVIPCAVLEDGTRVLSRAGFIKAIGRTGKAKGGRLYDEEFRKPVFLTASNLNPYVPKELLENSTPIPFRMPNGTDAMGYKADILPQVCKVFLDAKEAHALRPNQSHIAEKCRILLHGFATTGITALVDEATGYQDVRARDALAKILEAFIAKELRKWVKTFPTEFYKEMFRLRKWKFSETPGARPALVGHITNDLVYSRLAPGVLDELRRLTPRDDKGRLKTHLHRRLTEDIGHPKLREHLAAVVALMRAFTTWAEFKAAIDRALPAYGRTLPLPLEGETTADGR